MEKLTLTSIGKEERYKEILPQIESIISSEDDVIANLANVAAILKEAFDFFWVGFYIVKPQVKIESGKEKAGEKAAERAKAENKEEALGQGRELVLGPFQGPLACTRIKYGRGVCGTAWQEARTLVVPDVEKFPGHIACSSLSRSEIVVPIFDKEQYKIGGYGSDAHQLKQSQQSQQSKRLNEPSSANVVAVLDIDSKELATFDEIDAKYLEKLAEMLSM